MSDMFYNMFYKKTIKENDVLDYQKFCPIETEKFFRDRMGVGDIFSNSVKCLLCDEEIRSKNRRHYVTCKCGNVSIDGGSHYISMSIHSNDESTVMLTTQMYNDCNKGK